MRPDQMDSALKRQLECGLPLMPAGADIKKMRHAYGLENRVNRLERFSQFTVPNEMNGGAHSDPRVLIAAVIKHGHPFHFLTRPQMNGETVGQTNTSREGIGE